jgi:hypothetical protein
MVQCFFASILPVLCMYNSPFGKVYAAFFTVILHGDPGFLFVTADELDDIDQAHVSQVARNCHVIAFLLPWI